MATFIPGITDVYPPQYLYKPDWDRMERNLSIANSRYQQGVSKVRSFYDSIFNAPLTGDDNIKKRDEYLKQITESLRSVSSLDFSQEANQQLAYSLIAPITSDKNLAKDIVWTRNLQNQLSQAEQLRTSSDPNTRRRYSEEGMKALRYMEQDFKNATAAERMGMSLPSYTENVDLMAYANKLFKERGISVKRDESSGGYIWTKKNGDIAVPLTDMMVSDMLGNDPAVKAMLQTRAFVERKDAIQQRLPQFNNDIKAAEKDYLTSAFGTLKSAHETKLADNTNHVKVLKQKVNDFETKIKTRGIIPGSKEHKDYLAALEEYNMADQAAQNYRNNAFDYSSVDMNNVEDLKNAVDNFSTSNSYLKIANDLSQYLAYKDSEITMKADPIEQARRNQQMIFDRQVEIERIKQNNRIEILQKKKLMGLFDDDGDTDDDDDDDGGTTNPFDREENTENPETSNSSPFQQGAKAIQSGTKKSSAKVENEENPYEYYGPL